MNAPTTPLQQITLLPIGNLFPSPTNPRTRFNEAKLRELSDSIKHVGIAQPLLVRAYSPAHRNPPSGKTFEDMQGHFEIVAGERRFRAATLAGLQEVPCYVRDLTNQQVLHLQLIENLQRDDLHPIEEAEGYERLMLETNPNDPNGGKYTAEDIAAEIGKSRSYVFQRRKLLALCTDARQAFFDGKIDASTALLIARISPDKIQLEALNDVLKRDMSYRQTQDHIQRYYMLDLKTAVFDIKDAALLKKVGACDGCPKRTGNQPDLFSDVKSKDVCTDTVCFAMKKAAHFLIIRNQAEAEGAQIISGAAAKKILPSNYSHEYYLGQSGYAKPNEKIPNDPKGRTWEQALKQTKLLGAKDGEKPRVIPTVIENPHEKGEIIQAFNIEQAAKALREQGYEVTLRGTTTRHIKTDKEKAEEEKLRTQTKAENLYRARLSQAIHDKANEDLSGATPQLRPELFRLLAIEIFDQSKAYAAKTQLIETHLGAEANKKGSWEANRAFKEHLQTLHPQLCMLVMIDLIMSPEEKVESWQVQQKDKPDTLLALAAMHGIDAATLKKQAEQEIKEEVDAKKKAKAAKAPSKPAKAKPADKKAAAPTAKKPAAEPAKPAAPVTKRVADWPFPTPGVKPSEPSSTPTPAAQAQESGAETKAAPTKPVHAKAGTKRKAAAAA